VTARNSHVSLAIEASLCSDHGVPDPTIEENALADLPTEVVAGICELKSIIWQELVPSDPLMTPDAALSELLSAPAQTAEQLVIAKVADTVVGIGMSHHPTSSANANLLTVTVEVHPSHRRVGIGRLLLRALLSAGRKAGCDSILSWGPRTTTTNSFWDAFGMSEVQRSSRSRAVISAIDADAMANWAAASTARSNGYQMRSFVGACPNRYMEIYTTALNGMQDAPSDGLAANYEPLDKLGVRSSEARLADRGGTGHVILAVDSAGKAAGLTEVAMFGHTPGVVFQQTTTTLAEHRRQGLGRWLKAEMYYHIIGEWPDANVIETGNADSNTSMLAVNAGMGFAPFLSYTIRQCDITRVVQRLEVGGYR
jgi:GNAT superfamily N-acetyltransferase